MSDAAADVLMHAPAWLAAVLLAVAAARRWRDRRAAGALLGVAAACLLLCLLMDVPVVSTAKNGWTREEPLGVRLLRAAGAPSFTTRRGPYFDHHPFVRRASWWLLAISAGCGLLAALPAPTRGGAGRGDSGER